MVLHIFTSNNLIECKRLSQKQKHQYQFHNKTFFTLIYLQICQQGKHEYIYAHTCKQPRYKTTRNLIVPIHQNTPNKMKDVVTFLRHQTSSLVEGAFFSSPTTPTAHQFSRFCQLLLKTNKLKLLKRKDRVQRGVGGGHAFQSSVLVPKNFQAHEPLDHILD